MGYDVRYNLDGKEGSVRMDRDPGGQIPVDKEGRFDAFWESGLSEWDMAAGALLIQEAGGLVSDFTGGHDFLEKGHVVAGNTKCFKAVLTAIQPHLPASLKR